MTVKKTFHLIVLGMMLLVAATATAQSNQPKREFRGAWMHIIGQSQYASMSTEKTQAYLVDQLDALKRAGVNAVIWQIRPQADAAYPSRLEPWSRWITGKAGKAPNPEWDPLQFMITECHKRGMELHAWINPYRVTTSKADKPAPGHIYYQHPEWFVSYADGKIYFDPALPESRDFICKVVKDIVTRYDVDAIHMDDYFYPYPVTGKDFPDAKSFAKYGKGWANKGDWRRHNVDLLIEQLHKTLQASKPWVRLGISPFGIWRNKSSDPTGSATSGLECYDALYADCPKWTKEGWVDYMVPQLYWQMEHKAASDAVLMDWWNGVANGRGMYYGLAVRNTMNYADTRNNGKNNQLSEKIEKSRSLTNVGGIVWWPGYDVTANYKGVAGELQQSLMSHPALVPAYTWLDSIAPDQVERLRNSYSTRTGFTLSWQPFATQDPMQQAVRYVIYRFADGEPIDITRPDAIVGITGETSFNIKPTKGRQTYAVTVLDRCNNESEPIAVKVNVQ